MVVLKEYDDFLRVVWDGFYLKLEGKNLFILYIGWKIIILIIYDNLKKIIIVIFLN